MNNVQNNELPEKNTLLNLLIRQVRYEAQGVLSYELVSRDGQALPPFSAGAHLDVHIGPGLIRQYSLCNNSTERHRYVIAVLRDDNGRGGSRTLHEVLKAGSEVVVSEPRNHFELESGAASVTLIAGGIGITPIKAMAHRLQELALPFELHYCAKGPEYAAFKPELEELSRQGVLHYHFDGGDAKCGLDLASLLATQGKGQHLYYCGPAGFMDACASASSGWEEGTVHFEHFKAPVQAQPALEASQDECLVELTLSKRSFLLKPGQNLAVRLREEGVALDTSCESGLCGTCTCSYSQGQVDHQDYILDEGSRASQMTPCVSRPVSARLVLKL